MVGELAELVNQRWGSVNQRAVVLNVAPVALWAAAGREVQLLGESPAVRPSESDKEREQAVGHSKAIHP